HLHRHMDTDTGMHNNQHNNHLHNQHNNQQFKTLHNNHLHNQHSNHKQSKDIKEVENKETKNS
ncbi:protein of unknown function, DUF4106 family, partial [Trichomonas vaginalis G3]|uniref:protein of unknown function, DUF4106 family n=1 Tax=Trichomonas vaginalis (strain ATCC PRA-98 / G3) TaxID=412133 RepID=UPI0021E56CE0